MKSFNEKIQELELIRSLLHERIKNGLSKKVGKFYDELIADIQARILKDKNITRILSKTISDLKEALETPDLRAAFFAIAKDEVDFLHKNYNDLAGFSMFSNVLKPKQIETLLATTLVQGATIKAWNYGLQADQAKRLERDLKIGISLGETNALLAQRIAASLGKSKREATTLAVTGAGAIVSEARQKFFEANDDVIKYYQYQATLDTRTSELCRAYDGLLWDTEYKPVDHKLPFRMPRVNTHFNCRSTIIPITKSWEELGVEGMEEIDVGTRASMNGYVPKNMNFNDWLKTQSPETIEKTLGKGRAELFLQGKITMRDLITQQGRSVDLDELYKNTKSREYSAQGVKNFNIPNGLSKKIGLKTKNIKGSLDYLYSKHPEMFKNKTDMEEIIKEALTSPEIIKKSNKNGGVIIAKSIDDNKKKMIDIGIYPKNGVIFHINKKRWDSEMKNFKANRR
ncbi:minor capsid protein [Campylobacter sp. RM16191]|uniref:minor capsid protein n=1 Tax=Campylobacter sp. RM16191 TaxID=1705728 RepID=UPI00147434B0|nr:minor capsid protein [Campylobacter sp. RM16191]